MKTGIIIIILFIISNSVNAQVDTTRLKYEELIIVVEEMPEFVGGYKALKKYINTNIRYTERARTEKIAGKVYVSFVVETDGSISQPAILRSLDPDLDSISISLVKNMPNWTPAMQKGKPIRCEYNMPIEFILDKRQKTHQ